ncbi:uncharacterized protein LOC131937965 isoform X2 [Physella acuta]|uniref:uncharacterized protein LOC131937965 isoform X2 n=1 Tax=Physella acuta TaxID=109671 RepID=UPI0027DE9F0F|nr:uncharacterized protein LOC131937965 isoform X2 [Physella acuta]
MSGTPRRATITTLNNSTFSGILHDIDYKTGKIILRNVSTDGVTLLGPQHFYSSNIISLQFEGDTSDFSELERFQDRSESFAFEKASQDHLSKLKDFDTDELALSSIFKKQDEDQESGNDEEFDDFYETDEFLLLHKMCPRFYDAIAAIMEQEVVGVNFEGVDIGRNGTLSLIQVATQANIFIFDIIRMGNEAFDEGLCALFESKNILKVIHDCRWISDMLYHQYAVALVNVFDTQVANAFVYRMCNGGDWPRYVESLPGCLVSHLNLPDDQVHFMRIRERAREKDQAVVMKRPLPEKLLSAICKNVGYLIKLQMVLLRKMMIEFKTGVNLYMNHVDNMGGEIEKCRANMHLLPYGFIDLKKYVKCNVENNRREPVYDSKGFRENCLDIKDKEISFTHDSIWHRSKHSASKMDRGRGREDEARYPKKLYRGTENTELNCSDGLCRNNIFNSEMDETSSKILHPSREEILDITKKKSLKTQLESSSVSQLASVPTSEPNLPESAKLPSPEKVSANIRQSKLWKVHLNSTETKDTRHLFLRPLNYSAAKKFEPAKTCEDFRAPMEKHMTSEKKETCDKDEIILTNDGHSEEIAEQFSISAESQESTPFHSPMRAEAVRHSPMAVEAVEQKSSLTNLIPAGFNPPGLSKKKLLKLHTNKESVSSKPTQITADYEEELSYIPQQHSLIRNKVLPLNSTTVELDLLSEEPCPPQDDEFIKSLLTYQDEDAIGDDDLERFHKTKTFTKIIQLASSNSSTSSIKKKLLPSKITLMNNSKK